MFGNMRGLLDQETIKPKSTGETLRRLFRYFGPYWPALLVVLVLMVASSWVQVIVPDLFGQAVDCYLTPITVGTPSEGGATVDTVAASARAACRLEEVPADATRDQLLGGLLRLSLMLGGLQVLGAVCGVLMFFLMGWSGQQVLRRLQVDLFNHLQ